MQTQSQSSCRASGQGFELNELAKRMHDHSHIKRLEHAALFRTGELDIDLLMAAKLTVPESIQSSPVVSVTAASMVFNGVTNRMVPVFAVRDEEGQFQGHYFATAFKTLTL